MTKSRKILGVFTSIILALFVYGIVHSYVYDSTIEQSGAVEIPKDQLVDMAFPKYDISNRAISPGEELTRHYKIPLTDHVLETYLGASGFNQDRFYLMIEKPDAQYLEVTLNGLVMDHFGDQTGQANLWNGIVFVKIDKEAVQEKNSLIITMYSDYMTGVAGRIFIVPKADYRSLEIFTSFSEGLVKSTTIVAFCACVLLFMIIMAWQDQLYNLKAYTCFMIAIFFLGIALMDFSNHNYLWTSYFTFKKAIVLSYHFAITFAGLAIAYMVNAKYKWNIGMIGLAIMIIQSIVTQDLIEFRQAYAMINYLLVVATIQIVGVLFYYRRRAKLGAGVLLTGFSLTGITVLRLVFITSSLASSSMLIDLPIIIVIFITIILFLLYQEMVQVVSDNDTFDVDDRYRVGVTNYMQGAFSIDQSLGVVGAYSATCDRIFDRHIVGEKLVGLFGLTDEEASFLEDTLTMYFDPMYTFKDGFIALLPERLTLNERKYQLNYAPVEHSELRLRITMTDITRSVELKELLKDEKTKYSLIINALKSRQEVGYLIERTKVFFNRIEQHGFTAYHQAELHTLKGNLGQFGFRNFEQAVHEVESALLQENYDASALLKQLKDGFNTSLDTLEAHIELSYFDQGYGQIILTREEVFNLEQTYKEALNNHALLPVLEQGIKELRYIDLKSMFHRYNDYIARMSHDTEKNILPFEAVGDSIKVSPEKAENLVRVLVAIFRNAVVHGIEIPEIRTELSKDSFGKIDCQIHMKDDRVFISIEDDGEGIDLNYVEKKGIQYGITSKNEIETLDESQRLDIIFEPGMSQLEDVDILAGRGIGLYSVKEVVRSMEGTISVHSRLNEGTGFEIIVPLKHLRDE